MLRKIGLSALSGLILALPFVNGKLWLCAWFALVPLLFALENKSKGKAFLLAYLCGVIFWAGTIYWLIHVTLPGTVILILYLALYFGVFGLIYSFRYETKTMSYEIVFVSSIWVILEYIRSRLFTGFPWALLGYSQYLNLPVIQTADIAGAWGVSFLVMLVNITIYLALTRNPLPVTREKQKYILPLLCLLVTLGYGYYKINAIRNAQYAIHQRVSVIQGNIPQELKWQTRTNNFIIDRYFALTGKAAQDKPGLIIWPEAALPVILEEETQYFKRVEAFVKEIKIPLLFGAVTTRNNFYYNSAVLVSASAGILGRYDKLHLVPFGEYIPLKKILPFLETVVPIGDITPGRQFTVFSLSGYPVIRLSGSRGNGQTGGRQTKFSVLICFEDLFPALSRQFIKEGADFLVNITNDAWYKKTTAPYQHLQASIFRAVENRVFLVRSANTGISGFIAPEGKIISLVRDGFGKDIFVSGYDTQEIVIEQKKRFSFYTRFGDSFILVCIIFVLYGIISSSKKH
jgi:apolipoprotein N-acyltransferase